MGIISKIHRKTINPPSASAFEKVDFPPENNNMKKKPMKPNKAKIDFHFILSCYWFKVFKASTK